MSSERKVAASSSDFEVESHDLALRAHQKKLRLVDSARLGLTLIALLSGLTVLGTSANTLAVYNSTHLPSKYNLALWPNKFDVRPEVALVVGSTLVTVANIVSLVFSKVRVLRNQAVVHTSLTFAAPFVGFVASLVSMTFFYAINASTTVDTVQSWSCRWNLANMSAQPHFSSLCDESKTALYLSVILVPVELIIFTVAGYQMIMERKAAGLSPSRKTSSPALS
ncbi:hypothetical protein F4780DRAFT_776922 [Xylariomycetidae sp. FL0641]|nr:hypothetical protein F4780DRAFT_776922 [Xylariomycetidae sp. FL0641]